MHTVSQDKFGLHNLWAGGKAAMRRLLPLVAVVVALGLVTTTAPRAQGNPSVLVKSSEWVIKHGILDERYNFRANGSYDYLRSAGLKPLAVDSGTYTVQGNRLILRPTGGPEKILRWRIGTQDTEYYKQSGVLYLNYPDGREEFYYPNMNR